MFSIQCTSSNKTAVGFEQKRDPVRVSIEQSARFHVEDIRLDSNSGISENGYQRDEDQW